MAKNEFLPFGIADGANVLTNEEYGKLATRTNGFSSGVAKSQELNKVWRQASVIASVVAQFIAETNNQDVLDDGNTAALRAGLLNALRATVGSNIPVASQTTAGIAKLSNATNSEAENVAATPKAVKQAADMANQARTEAGNANATANTANQNAGNAITNANTANQNAANANNNANSRLEKNQNGADIPNKPAFVENLGLAGTKKQAENAMAKWQNGADISDKNAFVNNLGLTDTVDRANNTWLKSESDNRYIQSSTIELGPTTALSELAGKTGFYSRASKPLPPDSPLPNALKILTMGDAAWPTQMVYSSYENRAFIRTRTEANGRFREWSEFLTDNQLTQTTGGSTTHVMSQQAVTTVTNALSDAVRERLPIAKFNDLPVSFENVLTGQHGMDSPVTLRKSISNRLIFLQHGGHPGYTPLACGIAGVRLEFKFGTHGYTAFDVSADGRILSNWRFTSGYSVIGIFIVNGDA